MSSKNNLLKKNIGFLLVALLSIGIVTEISLITNANALNYYFNCVTKKVNKSEKFEIQDAFACYDNVFKGAQKYSNEPYQNPDLTNLDNIKPVASASSDTSSTDDEKADKPIITPVEEEKKTNGNPVADEETESANGNPVADEINKKTGNPVADKEKSVSSDDDTDKGVKSLSSDDDTDKGVKSLSSDDDTDKGVKSLSSDDDTDKGVKSLSSGITPKVDTVGKPNSSPKSSEPVNENSNKEKSPNLESNSGLLDISPLYKTFDLPFTAVIPQ
jgi:hypothetical protein